MTSQNSDHCEHCDRPSCRWVSEGLAELHRDHNGAEWAGICPACAERERIVAWLRAKAEREWESELEGSHYIGNALDMAADDIRDGKHLEDNRG